MLKQIFICFALLCASPLLASKGPDLTKGSRYQTQVYKGTFYLIDTHTGELWWLEHYNSGGYRWVKLSVETPQDQEAKF